MTTNPAVAALARTIAAEAAGGTLTRRAAGCVVVAYSTTKTDVHARRVLADLDDDELQAACHELADQLAAQLLEPAHAPKEN